MPPFSSPYFLVQITATLGGTPAAYGFVEVWMDSTLTPVVKIGGRYGNASQPGYAVDGSTFSVGALAYCRSADGNAGLTWELSPVTNPSCWKSPPARARTTDPLPANTYYNGPAGDGVGATLTGSASGTLPSLDGVTLAVSDSLLVANEVVQFNNGIYTVTDLGSSSAPYILTRRTDADTGALLLGAIVVVSEGTLYANTVWECTPPATITVGTTALPWQQLGGLSSPLTTQGDIWGYSTTDARVPVGTDGQVLTADSSAALGVQWADLPTPYSLTVENYSSTSPPTVVAGVTTIEVNDGDGLRLFSPSPGVADLDLYPASPTQTGVVTTSTVSGDYLARSSILAICYAFDANRTSPVRFDASSGYSGSGSWAGC